MIHISFEKGLSIKMRNLLKTLKLLLFFVLYSTIITNTAFAANVKWTGGGFLTVTATGYSAPYNYQEQVFAQRVATVAAQRNLLEIINGVQIDSETTIENLYLASDVIKTNVNGLLKGATIVEEGQTANGAYYVKMQVPLFGASNSVASAVLPQYMDALEPKAIEKANKKNLSKETIREISDMAYTGIIIDAKGLGLEPSFSPVIYDSNGRGIYGIRNIDKEFAISQGMVEYSNDLANASINSRAGNNPLVIKALATKGGGNSKNMVNVVVSVEDGDKILLANEKTGFLAKCSVVFVK